MKKYIWIFLIVCVVVIVSIISIHTNFRDTKTINRKIKNAVLEENWTQVTNLLSSIDTKTKSPIIRLIKAHACLALNQNNKSLSLFSSISSEDELKQWQQWCADFTAQNPENAITHYFDGDALARLKQWDSALVSFKQGLEIQPNHSLILNAQGVIYALKKEWDRALIDFYMSTKSNNLFADAYASCGAIYIQRKEGADGALEWSDRALKISKDFAIALNTRGCARAVFGEWGKAIEDFELAAKKTDCLSIVLTNMTASVNIMNNTMSKEVANLTKSNPGVTMQNIIQNMPPSDRDRLGKMTLVYLNHSSKSLGFMESIPKSLVVITPSGPMGLNTDISNWKNNTQAHMSKYNEILKWTGRPKSYTGDDLKSISIGYAKGTIPGGVSTNMQNVYVEEGKWPFIIQYGLLYSLE